MEMIVSRVAQCDIFNLILKPKTDFNIWFLFIDVIKDLSYVMVN